MTSTDSQEALDALRAALKHFEQHELASGFKLLRAGIAALQGDASQAQNVKDQPASSDANQFYPTAYVQGTGLFWPDEAPVNEPDCEPLYRDPNVTARVAQDAALWRAHVSKNAE